MAASVPTRRADWLRTTTVVGAFTVREVLRPRLVATVTVIGVLGLLVFGADAGSEGVSPRDRVMALREGVLFLLRAVALLTTLFAGAFLIPGDLESRRLHTILAKPVPPSAYLFGRWAGLMAVALLILAALGAGGALLIARVAGDAGHWGTNRVPVLAEAVCPWGDARTPWGPGAGDDKPPEPSARGLDTLILQDAREHGAVFRFAGLSPREDLDPRTGEASRGVLLEFHAALRLRSGRSMGDETVTLTARPPGATHPAATFKVPLQHNRRARFRVPATALAPDGGLEVLLQARGSSYVLVLEPDALQVLGPPTSHGAALAGAGLALWLQMGIVLGVVVLLSAVFSPYTALLGGFFTWLLGSLSGSLVRTLNDFDRQLEFAIRRLEHHGVPLDETMSLGKRLLVDTGLGDVLRAAAGVLPDFGKFHITDQFVLGYDTAGPVLAGAAWYYLFWSLSVVFVAVVLFAWREYA